MKPTHFQSIFCFAASVLLLSSCGPTEQEKKKTLATHIAKETCDDISNLTTGLAGGLINTLFSQITDGNIADINTGNLGKIPEYWCDCYTYFVVKELTEKFTYKELLEIKRDNAKQMMVLQKIIEIHQEDLKGCVAESTNKIFKNYSDFSKDLDKKFKQ